MIQNQKIINKKHQAFHHIFSKKIIQQFNKNKKTVKKSKLNNNNNISSKTQIFCCKNYIKYQLKSNFIMKWHKEKNKDMINKYNKNKNNIKKCMICLSI